MNEIEKQILKNQKTMFTVLTAIYTRDRETKEGIIVPAMEKCYWETIELLNPESTKEDCCEMPERFAEQKTGEQDE